VDNGEGGGDHHRARMAVCNWPGIASRWFAMTVLGG
jgi:hypothetical protein